MRDINNETDIKKIHPEKITKPIQLLAAWLVGLVATNASFLATAILLPINDWAHYMLLVASVINIPLFLSSMFLLQTKFRPELQEDSFYSTYILSNKGKNAVYSTELERQVINSQHRIKDKELIEDDHEQKPLIEFKEEFDFLKYSVSINDYIKNYQEIKKHLEDNGIPVGSIFGKANDQDGPPEKWVISIDKNMEKASMIYFLNTIIKYADQFEGFYLGDRLSMENETIFIGGYITNRPLLPINSVIIDRLKHNEN